VDWKPIDFSKIADGFGANGFLIEEKSGLESVLPKVLNDNGPSVIAVRVRNMPSLRKDVMKKLLIK
jgi:thiamine pyrophosphate-dependent acetolactate synthase large subunit-like protein